jgi:4-amino-4-deoxy-L-arabinose transferase-like glycosyltransferase
MLTDQHTLHGPDSERQAFWLLLLLGLIILGAGLGLRDPWPADEPRFALVAKQMVESGQWLFPFRGGEIYPDKPPMFMWAIALFYQLTGSMRVAFLLPSLLAGLGSLALVFDIARRIWDTRTAFRAGLLLLFTVQFTVQAKLAQIDALVTFFITLGLYGFLRFLLCGSEWRWYYLGWFAAGLGIITKGVGILAALVLIPALWTHRHSIRSAPRSAWLKALAGPLFMGLAIALWLVPMVLTVAASHDASFEAYRNNILFRQTVTRYANAWHHVKPFWYYLTEVVPAFWLPLSLLLPWIIWQCREAFRQGNRAVILLVGYLVLMLCFFSFSPGKRGVYITPGTPALALLAAPWLPLLLERRWPRRLLQGLGWLVSSLFLAIAVALLVSPKLAAKTAELGSNPWLLALSVGLCGLLVNTLLRQAPLSAVLGTLTLVWLHYSLWAYPLMNDVRTPRGIMSEVNTQVPAQDELLIVKFREQFLLFADRPIQHWSYQAENQAQIQASAHWIQEAPNRWLLAPASMLDPCFDPAKGQALGLRHGEVWTLYRIDALRPVCQQATSELSPYRYVPQHGYQ